VLLRTENKSLLLLIHIYYVQVELVAGVRETRMVVKRKGREM